MTTRSGGAKLSFFPASESGESMTMGDELRGSVLAGVLMASGTVGWTSCTPSAGDSVLGDASRASSTSIASSASPLSKGAGVGVS